jgi:serine/threonine protein kinase
MICSKCLSEHQLASCPYCGEPTQLPSVMAFEPEEKTHEDLLPTDTILLERYKIIKVLGVGGFGITYLARHTQNDLEVAIKEYFPVGARRSKKGVVPPVRFNADQFQYGVEAHLNEGYVLGRIRHPSIVQVHEAFSTLGTAYVVMSYLRGQTLFERLNQHGSISAFEAAQYAIQLLKALELLHRHKIIHRDIKPENIIITGNRAVLIDFGAAREFSPNASAAMSRIYTHGYAPPEQYDERGRFGAQVDIYALSATLYHLLMDKIPETSTIRSAPLVLPDRLKKQLPGLCAGIEQGLEINPNNRPQSATSYLELVCSHQDPNSPIERTREQLKAIEHQNGLLKVQSHAGAGKTLTLISRCEHLILANPKATIAVTTFNKALATEIGQQLQARALENVFVGQLGKLVKHLLEHHKIPKSFYDHPDIRGRIIQEAFDSINDLSSQQQALFVGITASGLEQYISQQKHNLQYQYAPEWAAKYVKTNPQTDTSPLPRLFRQYQKLLDFHGLLDFDDQMLLVAIGSSKAGTPFDHFLVDEYQSMTSLEHYFVSSLTKKCTSAVMFADVLQNIYTWRGASVEHFVNLKIAELTLPDTFRSPPLVQAVLNHTYKSCFGDSLALSPTKSHMGKFEIHYCNSWDDVLSHIHGIDSRTDCMFISTSKKAVERLSAQIQHIPCTTIHASRGREADVIFAHFDNQNDIESLLYVAATRAGQALYILHQFAVDPPWIRETQSVLPHAQSTLQYLHTGKLPSTTDDARKVLLEVASQSPNLGLTRYLDQWWPNNVTPELYLAISNDINVVIRGFNETETVIPQASVHYWQSLNPAFKPVSLNRVADMF